jgi:hypothetical protein
MKDAGKEITSCSRIKIIQVAKWWRETPEEGEEWRKREVQKKKQKKTKKQKIFDRLCGVLHKF